MNYPENELLNERIKKIRNKAENILNKGLVENGSSRLEKTLEKHEHLKVLIDELNFALAEENTTEAISEIISRVEEEIREL